MLRDGLYEQIISKALDSELSKSDKISETAAIDSEEASKVLAKYIADVIEKGLDNVKDNGGDLYTQVGLANKIISTIISETNETEFDSMSVAERAEQLLSLFDRKNSILAVNEKAKVTRPETSIAQSSLFTGAVHEPQMFSELKKEIISCNRIDMLVSFIKWSGLRLIIDIDDVKGLGFCVSVEHAEFMSRYFNDHGIPSMYLTGDSPDDERSSAKNNLVSGKYRFIFVVDIYNEGVDIPEVNTVLFLRPTESLTVFLQQLGRGLRLAEDKECLTVLDFIGQANKKYNFEQKFAALLSNTEHSVERELKNGFVSVPKGCYIQLEKKAAKYILDNIRASYGNTAGLVNRISTFEEDTGLPLTLSNFLGYYHIDPRMLYKYSTFTMLCDRAEISKHIVEPADGYMQKALLRLCTIDSRRLIDFLINILPDIRNINISDMPMIEQRMMQMFYITMWLTSAEDWNSEEVKNNISSLADSPDNMRELTELLKYKYDMIDFIDEPVDIGFDCPLDLHCTYTRDQLLVALDHMKPSTVREGVKWLPEKKIDVFFVTLNKSDKDYSPTTMYNDYSINEELFHWQSQSTTSDTSPTGRRYINHRQNGSRILLFVREFKSDRVSGGAAAYTFLGTARYVSHTGSRPMNITWKLDRPIPAKFLKKTNKLVVG